MSRERVCEVAGTWLGTPWHHAQQVRGVGVDCAHLLIGVYAEAGVIDPFVPEPYPIDCMLHSDHEIFLGWCQRLGREVHQPAPGDAVVWRVGRTFSHGGIVIDWPGRILHAFRPYGRVCETPADAGILAGREARFFSFVQAE
jgi:cell wall-associated NlpC family hydrolase